MEQCSRLNLYKWGIHNMQKHCEALPSQVTGKRILFKWLLKVIKE